MRNLFLLTLFLINLPPVFFLSKSFSISRIIEFLWLAIFVFIFVSYLRKSRNLNLRNNEKRLLVLLLLLLFSQSLSVINAINTKVFITRYETILFPIISLFLSLLLINSEKIARLFTLCFLLSFILPVALQLVIFVYPEAFINLIAPLLRPDAANLIVYNIERGRVYLEDFNYLIIPFLFYFFVQGKNIINRLVIGSFFIVIIFLSLVSNFRTAFLLTIASTIGSFYIYRKQLKSSLFFIIFILLFFLGSFYFLKTISHPTVFERLDFFNTPENYVTLMGRLDMWKRAFEMGRAFPLFGVGLGNFFDYAFDAQTNRFYFSTIDPQKKIATLQTIEHPHNIFLGFFAESGLVGLLSIVFLVLYFIRRDVHLLKTASNPLVFSFILSFWLLFMYSTVNPANVMRFYFFFFFTRALIEKLV